jgi:hypothetical protein
MLEIAIPLMSTLASALQLPGGPEDRVELLHGDLVHLRHHILKARTIWEVVQDVSTGDTRGLSKTVVPASAVDKEIDGNAHPRSRGF